MNTARKISREEANTVVAAHDEWLQYMVRRYSKGRPVHYLDDALQEARIELFRALDTWDPEGTSLKNYAWGRVMQSIYKRSHPRQHLLYQRGLHLSKVGRKATTSLDAPIADDSTTLFHEVIGDGVDLESDYWRAELKDILQRALDGLEETPRKVVEMWLDGSTFREIGVAIGRTRSRAGQILEDTLKLLRVRLTKPCAPLDRAVEAA